MRTASQIVKQLETYISRNKEYYENPGFGQGHKSAASLPSLKKC